MNVAKEANTVQEIKDLIINTAKQMQKMTLKSTLQWESMDLNDSHHDEYDQKG